MNNLSNRRYLEYKKENAEEIKDYLRYEFLRDLINKGYTMVKKDDMEHIIHNLNYDFYYGEELEDYDLDVNSVVQIYDGKEDKDNIYVTEGTLTDENEDVIEDNLSNVLDRFIELVMNKGYVAPMDKCECKVYHYFLVNYMFK